VMGNVGVTAAVDGGVLLSARVGHCGQRCLILCVVKGWSCLFELNEQNNTKMV
jgi:hypothetical protein